MKPNSMRYKKAIAVALLVVAVVAGLRVYRAYQSLLAEARLLERHSDAIMAVHVEMKEWQSSGSLPSDLRAFYNSTIRIDLFTSTLGAHKAALVQAQAQRKRWLFLWYDHNLLIQHRDVLFATEAREISKAACKFRLFEGSERVIIAIRGLLSVIGGEINCGETPLLRSA